MIPKLPFDVWDRVVQFYRDSKINTQVIVETRKMLVYALLVPLFLNS